MMCRLLFLMLVAVNAPLARAGMILDGVPDSNYLAYGAQFQAAGKVGSLSGTLIAPQWVLTAAHVGNGNFTINGQTYASAQYIPHPQFALNGSNINYGYDIALIRLATPVVGVAPIPIYTGSSEVNSLVAITGYGTTGVGSLSLPSGGGVLRGGTNIVDGIFSFDDGTTQIGAKNALLITDFDAPSIINTTGKYNTLGSAAPTSLEYHLAPGDSGGGVFIQENGKWYIAGVNSGVASQKDWTGVATDNTQLFGYGAISAFTRVSSYGTFINGFTSVPEPSSLSLFVIATACMGASRFRRKANKLRAI